MKLAIHNPCSKDWNEMTPNEKGAFCGSCQKNVLDFTHKSIEEIKAFFTKKPASEEVCARFYEQQFEELDFDAFINDFMLWRWAKRAAVVCFLIIGASLMEGCQPKIYKAPLAGTVQVNDKRPLSDTLKQVYTGEPQLMGDTLLSPVDTVPQSPVIVPTRVGKVRAPDNETPKGQPKK